MRAMDIHNVLGEGGNKMMYITVYIVCAQNNPGETMARKQQHNLKYEDKTARVRKIDPHKQT
jgi:hypothetical protein